jgi:hypothetical protein
MCALGVCDVVGAAEIIIPVMAYGGCERKHASDPPAGPAPTIRNGVSTIFDLISGTPLVVMVDSDMLDGVAGIKSGIEVDV